MIPTCIPRTIAAASFFVLASAVLHSPHADAASMRTISVSATGVCDAPLPVYNVHLRRRPVALQNESDQSVFVSCTLPTDVMGDSNSGSVVVGFKSFAGAATVSCTMVSGTSGAQVFYVPRDQAIAANGRAGITWLQVNKWSNSGTYAFSCNLPAGVAMETITYTQTDSGGRV
ncbi:hypothetical protein [Luteimonas sp. MC1572]|uniref:hypothetical protein n=1 Tax=Luteimonas sp. MC1572 TaxID=2799325 RepID=UPI0018F0E287|nr:hypothetical protein [Luteimonas sp. MC1572]MBJ6981724.1 hypothetical protein [Luteimonas sp. MC1572]QQO03012.1 hypothetical protein JGR64_12780 [Luteimonas sp. MC1572]